jgi:hypothetical protein
MTRTHSGTASYKKRGNVVSMDEAYNEMDIDMAGQWQNGGEQKGPMWGMWGARGEEGK